MMNKLKPEIELGKEMDGAINNVLGSFGIGKAAVKALPNQVVLQEYREFKQNLNKQV